MEKGTIDRERDYKVDFRCPFSIISGFLTFTVCVLCYRSAGTVALNEFGEYHSQRTPRIWVGPHRASVWSVGMDGTIQAWWEESGESHSYLVLCKFHRMSGSINMLN